MALVRLNPGADHRPTDHADFAMPAGSAHVVKRRAGHPPGRSPLLRQVRVPCDALRVSPEDVLAGNLVPFRSPGWASPHYRTDALRFGIGLWRGVLGLARPRPVIGMGREATDALAGLPGAGQPQRIAVGRGNVSASRAAFPGGRLLGPRHLFATMRRPQSQPGLRALFGDDWHG